MKHRKFIVPEKNKKPLDEKEIKRLLKHARKVYNPTGKKCPKCGSKDMFYDSSAGPIVGGFIVNVVRRDGTVGPSRGAHHTGAWICNNCLNKGLSGWKTETKEKQLIPSKKEFIKTKSLEDLLKCSKCGTPFKKIDDHTYKFACECVKSTLNISVG